MIQQNYGYRSEKLKNAIKEDENVVVGRRSVVGLLIVVIPLESNRYVGRYIL